MKEEPLDMVLKIKNIFKIIIICFILVQNSQLCGQANLHYSHLSDVNYEFYDYMINAGYISPQFAMHQPYQHLVFDSKKIGKNEKIYRYIKNKYFNSEKLHGVAAELEISDKLKYLNQNTANRYRASGSVYISYPYIRLFNRTTIDEEYKYDPKFAGDLSESSHWLFGRVNDAYMDIDFGNFNIFAGRMKRNWGAPDSYSLMLSNNPYSYDHLYFSYQNNFLKLSVLCARLEDLSALGLNIPDQPDSLTFYENARKFLVGHRLDVHFSKNLQIGLTEMATYGGPDRDFDVSFLNPMTFYYGLQRNDRKLNDGNWSLDIFYKPTSKFTLYGQFMIDDIVVNNEPGQNDRANHPDRFAMSISIRSGDLFLTGLNTNLSYVRIWNDTYQSRWTWENYHYRGLGLGYPCASCEEIKLKFGYWGKFPLFIQNEFIIGRYGDVSFTDVFNLKKESFPVPPVTYNIVNRFSAYYFLTNQTRFYLRLESYKDADHYLNRLNQGSSFTFSLGFSYKIGHSFETK